jgi:hypothetical protein
MEALKILAVGLVIFGLIFSMTSGQSDLSGPKDETTYSDDNGQVKDPEVEGLGGGVKQYKDRIVISPYGEQ